MPRRKVLKGRLVPEVVAIPHRPPALAVQVNPQVNAAIEFIAERVAERVEDRIANRLEHMPPPVQPALMDVKRAAIYLGRSEQAIQHLIFSKELPVVRVGRRVHLDRRDLDAWIEKNKY